MFGTFLGVALKGMGSAFSNNSRIRSGRNPGRGFIEANKFNKARGGQAGGYGAWTFGNIINAHSSADDIVEEFGLNLEQNAYGCTAYEEAYGFLYDSEFYPAYMDEVEAMLEIIEICEEQLHQLQGELEQAEDHLGELQDELEDLEDDLEMCDNPEDAEEILDEMHEVQEEIMETEALIEELEMEITEIEIEIEDWYSEIELLDPEEFVDETEVENLAFEYACEFAQNWIDGNVFIPEDVLDWAYYVVSDHNC